MEFKVGDQVRLKGENWTSATQTDFTTGDVATIAAIDYDGGLSFEGLESDWWDVTYQGWEVELLEVSSFEQSVRRHTDRIANVLVEKNKQYANSALDPIRVFSTADRMEQLRVRADDKLSRIRNGDTSEDALTDLAGYIILLKIAEESN